MLSQVCQAGQGHGSNGAVQLHDRRRPEGLVEITSKRPSYQLPRFQEWAHLPSLSALACGSNLLTE